MSSNAMAANPLPSQAAIFSADLASDDPELFESIRGELWRQQNQIELIASENVVSPAVLEAQGSVLTNKYAEGYPGRRYYGGCEFVDVAERLAIDRAKQLFSCEYANVQPSSGSQANQGAFHGTDQAGRYDSGHVAGVGRPSHPRRRAEPIRQMVSTLCNTAYAASGLADRLR